VAYKIVNTENQIEGFIAIPHWITMTSSDPALATHLWTAAPFPVWSRDIRSSLKLGSKGAVSGPEKN